jgi:molybdopterin biosynthesis enzyme
LARLISVQEAQRGILSQFSPVSTTIVPLEQSNGRVLSQDIYSEHRFPAVRKFQHGWICGTFAVDISNADSANPVSLAVVADIPAGIHPIITLKTGEAARIMTGLKYPAGADAVIPVERYRMQKLPTWFCQHHQRFKFIVQSILELTFARLGKISIRTKIALTWAQTNSTGYWLIGYPWHHQCTSLPPSKNRLFFNRE